MINKRLRDGFSLIEVLIVTAVIALLAGIIFAAIGPARRMGRITVCTAHLRQIGMAYKMYLVDYGQYPPPLTISPGSPYLKDHRLLYCPDDTSMALEGAGSSYIFRTQIPPNLTPLSELRTLHPDSALVICENHLGQNDIVLKDDRIAKQPPSYPYHLVLRADGRVTRVHVNGIRRFFGRFEPHGVFGLMLIYPGEPGYERGK